MSHLVDSGRAMYWGTSEWSAAQILEAYHVARREHLAPPQVEQPEYNLFRRERVERQYAPLYEQIGLGTTTWSPLAGGLLTGKYSGGSPAGSRATLPDFQWLIDRYEGDEARRRILKVRELEPVAAELGCTLAQLAIAWCLSNPRVSTVITGASRPEQVRENMQALEVAERLTPDLLQRIEDIVQTRPAEDYDWRG
jgi:aryl-alcohol dehydrogenase-like predicted oxidoreductase